ncbi:2-heptyl-3-hydroxy-4(1H)-quinolone synthase [Gracilariopsis chorda]|uniref:2-heptyl-3-hydroxy-4(1H)-quinolone synthase n=1 Tax=Gracilariopsis chorda TaxID=448386 RepID=A0A2V3IRS9_9FLOR|nr:2-heptyl-3-hydroxy-4(1H)-quinolone synthase [Gracilariopsis chorda]|eukprot:PXF44818.1 2-heptyl-3-hydroxy-4(1H)-quinolone synthase [Gracilariopsis chorda]
MNKAIAGAYTAAKVPILIVGGGLGSFTAALSLHRAGIQNKMIVPTQRFTEKARAGVFLGGSAVRILDRLGLGSQYRALGTPMYTIRVENIKGNRIADFHLDEIGTEVWTLPREYLQQLFLESIPSGSVSFRTKFRSLQIQTAGVKVKVLDINKESKTSKEGQQAFIDTRFVVGADGMNSAVRMCMSRPVMTVPSGIISWQAVVRNRSLDDIPLHIGKEIWDKNLRFGFARMTPTEVVWWAIVSNSSNVLLRPFAPRLLHFFKGFPSIVTDLISSVDSDRDISRAEMKRVWPEEFPWVDNNSSRIALVGDAGRPRNTGNFHMSTTLAIEDSYILANHLADQNEKGMLTVGPNLERYALNRSERKAVIDQFAKLCNLLSSSDSSIRRYLTKKLLRLSVHRLAFGGMSLNMPNDESFQRELSVETFPHR